MTTAQFRAFLAMVIVVVLIGAGYLVWHDTHPTTSPSSCNQKAYVIGCK